MIGRPFLSDSIPMLTGSFCPVVYQRQRITRDAQDLKSCESVRAAPRKWW